MSPTPQQVAWIEEVRRLLGLSASGASAESAPSRRTFEQRVAATKALLQAWTLTRNRARAGTEQLISALTNIEHAAAHEIADVVTSLLENFPTALDEALDRLPRARDEAQFAEACRLAHAGAANALRYLDGNAEDIALCESNPFGITVAVSAPTRQSLKLIDAAVKKLEAPSP